MTIDETGFDIRTLPLTRYAGSGSRLFKLHGNGSWISTWVIASIGSSGACVTAFHDEQVDGSNLLDLISRPDFSSHTSFNTDSTAFHKLYVVWDIVRSHIQLAKYSASDYPKGARHWRARHRVRKRRRTSNGVLCTRHKHAQNDEASRRVPKSRPHRSRCRGHNGIPDQGRVSTVLQRTKVVYKDDDETSKRCVACSFCECMKCMHNSPKNGKRGQKYRNELLTTNVIPVSFLLFGERYKRKKFSEFSKGYHLGGRSREPDEPAWHTLCAPLQRPML